MRRNSIVFVALLLPFFMVTGQKSLLWEISGNGIKTSYLFGTIHMVCADDFAIDAKVMDAFNRSDKLVLEIDVSDPQIMQKMQSAAVNKNFRNFKNDLTETDRFFLDSCFKADLKAGIDQLGILKPWTLMTFYSMSVSYDCPDRKQYETELSTLAKSQNKPIGQLETLEFQLAIFDSIPMQKQIDWLMETVREKNKNREIFARMIAAYKDQDVESLNQLTMEEEDMKELAPRLFFERNGNWIPVIGEMAREQPTFFAFGAGHLGGKDGVIDLLKQKGYKVKAIK
ncbi:MAG: TraB/GumN family protein [Breznakibacter sp.]